MESDPINSPEYENLIRDFCKRVRGQFTIPEISGYLESFKRSQTLKLIIQSPNNTTAVACLRTFLLNKPNLPADFLNKLISVSSSKVTIQSSSFLDGETYIVKLNVNKMKPPSKITNRSCDNIKRILLNDRKLNSEKYSANYETIPESQRVNFDDSTQNMIIQATKDLDEVIQEGYRMNGMSGKDLIHQTIKG